jgi:general secretion pathway protein F
MASTMPQSISHDQLIALCDEMAALARAGVPLEKGLVALAEDLPGRLGRLAGDVGRRLEMGEGLDEVLGAAGDSVSPAFRAVIVAGLRSGRLAVALEGVATALRRADELRRLARASLIYPLFVVALAYVLFVFTVARWSTTVVPAYEGFRMGRNAPLEWIAWLGESPTSWILWPPLAAFALIGLLWLATRRPKWSSRGGKLRRWPTPGKLMQLGRLTTFADVLSLLVRERVPLTDAVALAGEASGDRRLLAGARDLSQRLARGESPEQAVADTGAIPPLLAWRIVAGSHRGDLAELLHRAADGYRRQAQQTYDSLTVSLPLVLTAALGGTAVVGYGLAVVVPWAITLIELTSQA